MILPFIENTLDIVAENDKNSILSDNSANDVSALGNSLPENIDFISNENFPAGSTDNNTLQVKQNNADSFEMKYKTLMKKIEKERFERELLAGNR